ncbi:glucosamine 6-phosphate N-acetyltransferase-like isoform X2 [Mercenaria mercenaria]|uniref:glucosamine 6-phosphate N-acetyltransferase-like isoform X2 n=1 Tax=Mercenaria mercenaria TaxID=6596 RepID=UPI001E1DC157|nr:glucosamine 6-phosphate N-acetyltransferase-like isoform X2 [Mercenaria mercenaria]
MNGLEDVPLFDPNLVREVNFKECSGTYNPEISPESPGEGLLMRPLKISDYDRGFMELLKQLTVVGDVSREQFEARFNSMLGCKNGYYTVVIEDTTCGQVIGAATLAVEQKFIHECSSKGRIEDVVVDNKYRGKQLGKLLLDFLTLLSRHVGCYKVSLECKDQVVKFYTNFGYVKEEGQNYMCRRF